jgi:formate/nitrite transporter FocA (FNT family)
VPSEEVKAKQSKESDSATANGGSGPQVGTRFSAEEIHENLLQEADDEMERPASGLALSGLASGLGIGFSFLAVALLTSRMAPENHAIAAAIAYPLGFIFVVLARHQLFTENTLEPVIPFLERRDGETFKKLLRLWAIVLPANLIGAALFALVIARTRALDPALGGTLLNVARDATGGGAGIVFYKAIWAGWLIALMAWMIASTRETMAQIVLVWLTTAPIAAFGFKHSIAGAAEAFYRAWLGDATWGNMLASFELPALAGNIVGGVVLVALINHGQASSKTKAKSG